MPDQARVRVATAADTDGIREIYAQAFPSGEAETVANLALELLVHKSNPDTFALVSEADDRLIGHVAFSPVTIDASGHRQAYILAPLAVRPVYQCDGVGSTLVRTGLARLADQGVDVVFVYGDPAYYGRFGFDAAAASTYTAPYELQFPFGWQAITLSETPATETPFTITCVEPLSDPALW